MIINGSDGSPSPNGHQRRASDRTLLDVTGLRTWFPTPRGVVHAVDGVSFQLARGETLGIVGESGSGKSVLARSIMRLLPENAVTVGHVRFDGQDLASLPAAEARKLWGNRIGMIFQNPMTSLNPVMRIGRQITEVLRCHKQMNNDEAQSRAVELLGMVGIPEPEKRMRVYPHEMSGGMRQRVCIAIAIACQPRLLVADEPTTALDVTIQRQILDLMTDLCMQTHMAMILISHDLGVVAGRTDEVVVMYGGQVVETGPTRTIFGSPRHPYTRALIDAIPRVDQPSHTTLNAIPGRPAVVVDPPEACRFAARCRRAQLECTTQTPTLTSDHAVGSHRYACFFPVDTPEGDAALAANENAGRTAAGLKLNNEIGEV